MALTFLRNLGIISSAGISTSKLGAGAVLQVITATDANSVSTTSTSFTNVSNATLNVTITPSSAANKIFIVVTTGGYGYTGYFTIYRGATNLGDATNGMTVINNANSVPIAMSYLDSPSTTSAITYQVYQRSDSGAQVAITGRNTTKGSITAFEIAG
jgi:hypothetical protein